MSRYGEYDVLAPLASGGMGGVYLARHVTSGERVALKVLDPVFADHPEIVRRLYSECAIATRATHPGLVAIRGSGTTADNVPYLVMEYLDGSTLAQLLSDGAMAVEDVTTFGAQIAAALAALHDARIIHCDIKPDNLLVLTARAWGSLPQVKVIDFGVSRSLDELPPDDASIAGTPAYMAPEQWKGRPQLASDVYSLGCVVYELLTGETPFDGSLPQLMNAHLEQRPARLTWLRTGVPIELERLVMRALAKDPAMRPSMSELAMALGDLAATLAATDTMPIALAV